ncbi:unnamed protein product [Blepharisma stoltei]|uniref:Uncharacterized protein n=1 Tax=Blepharisma stoltei TaxID=1481888 RepID=A0AAU9JRB9_9CILI|nr:unnamed protein product [Blepharisma stoltei]
MQLLTYLQSELKNSRYESFNSQVKRCIKQLKRNSEIKIFEAFDKIIKTESQNFDNAVENQLGKIKLTGFNWNALYKAWIKTYTRYSWILFKTSIDKINDLITTDTKTNNVSTVSETINNDQKIYIVNKNKLTAHAVDLKDIPYLVSIYFLLH